MYITMCLYIENILFIVEIVLKRWTLSRSNLFEEHKNIYFWLINMSFSYVPIYDELLQLYLRVNVVWLVWPLGRSNYTLQH